MIVRVFALIALFVATSLAASASESPTVVSSLQALGAQIKRAADRVDHGNPPSSADVSDFEQQLWTLRKSVTAESDQRITSKYSAIALLFGKLKSDVANTSKPVSRQIAFARSLIEVETVTPSHGASCVNALGLAVDHPVQLTLQTRTDAWFFIAGGNGDGLRLQTTSAGPDPALEIFDRCGGDVTSIAKNDDSVGLDANVAVAHAHKQNMYVHLTNSGESGVITLAAATTPGSINGTVKDSKTGTPIPNATVFLFYAFDFFDTANTDQDGAYTLVPSQPGTYYVIAQASSYVTEVYPTGTCPIDTYFYNASACDFSNAQTVTVTATSSVSDIDFSLSAGQQLSGQVRGSDNSPLPARVTLLTASGQELTSVFSDSGGHYAFQTLPPGSYVVEADISGYGSQLYDHVACSGTLQAQCNTLAANPVVVGSQDIMGIDFTLPRLSSISGKVSTTDGLPLNGGYITVVDQNGVQIDGAGIDSMGNYSVGAITNATVYVFASSYSTFPQLYANHDCNMDCSTDLANATPITFTYTGQNVEADFVLDYLPTLTGHVTDATTGLPLRNVQVLLNTQPPNVPYSSNISAYTDALGSYSVTNVPSGQYFVWAHSVDHIDQIYSGIPCEASDYSSSKNCSVAGATLLSVAPTLTLPTFDFALNPSSSVSGSAILKAGVGSDLPALIPIALYDETGATVAYTSTDATGNYVLSDIPPGTYFAMTNTGPNEPYISQIWQNIDCTNCVPTTGTPIVVTQAAAVTNIDFQITRIDVIVGRVTDDAGNPIQGVVIDLFSSLDDSYVNSSGTDALGYFEVQASLGASYYVTTEAGGGYVDQVYSGIRCPAGTAYDKKCSLSGATALNLTSGAIQPHVVNFVLSSNDPIFKNGFD